MKNEKITAGLLFLRVLKLLFYLQMGLLLEILSIRIKTFSMSRVRPLDIAAKHVWSTFPFAVSFARHGRGIVSPRMETGKSRICGTSQIRAYPKTLR